MQDLGKKGKLEVRYDREGFLGGYQTTYLGRQAIHQLRLCVKPAVGEMPLEVISNTFVGILFRGIG